jgi:hypothetical protein
MQKLKTLYKKYWKQEPTSATSLAIYNAYCSAVSTAYRLRHLKILSKTKKLLSELATTNEEQKRRVFVFANGPSLKDIDLSKIRALQNQGNHDVIALNSFLSKSGEEIKPNYAIFADSIHFDDASKTQRPRDQYLKDIEYCRKNSITTLVPAEFYENVPLDTKLAFCTIGNIYNRNIDSICRPVGFYRLTALYALVLAKQLNYDRIYIAGFDNSYFKNFEVSEEGKCTLKHIHYYDKSDAITTVTPLANSTTEIFYDIYKHFYFIQKITKDDYRFINVAKETYISTIPIDHTLDIYKATTKIER